MQCSLPSAHRPQMPFSKITMYLAVVLVWLNTFSQEVFAQIPANHPKAEHGLRFEKPVTVWDEALPLGNGILGALVWGDGQPMRISLDRSDLWDLRPVPEFHSEEYSFARMKQWHEEGKTEDLIRLYEAPYHRPAPTKIPAGRIELALGPKFQFQEARLSLADAVAKTTFTDGAAAEVFIHAREPVGMIRLCLPNADFPTEKDIKLIAPAFGGQVKDPKRPGIVAGDLAQLGYPAPEETSGENWRAYHQQGAEGFHYAVYLAWHEREGHLEMAWSVASSAEGENPLARAKTRVEKALHAGYARMFASHRAWWDTYWSKSSVSIPNAVLQRQWFLEQYKFGSAARRGAPPITLQAVWTADNGRLPPWKGDYHHDLNTELSYWPCYSGNHLEEGLSYLDWLWETRQAGFDWTRRFFKLPGLAVPMTVDLEGKQMGGWRQYTHSATTSAWLAHHFYLHWKYSADRDFLRDRAYPYIRDVCIFLEAFTDRRNPDGKRTFPLSASPEIHDNRPEAWFSTPTNYDVALSRWLFGAAAELADELDKKDEAARWRKVLEELPELSLGEQGGLLVAAGHPLSESHRHHSHLMAIHPLGLIDVNDGTEARRIVEASLADLDRLGTRGWTGYSFSWLGNMAARAGNGAKAERALEIFATAFTLRNSFHCNGDQSGKGYSNYRYRPFTLEGNFAEAAGIQEMLLQSHRGVIRLFPAVPKSWHKVAFTTLRGQGAFLVSAELVSGKVTRVEILSEKGGICRLISPWSGKTLSLAMKPGEKIVRTDDNH